MPYSQNQDPRRRAVPGARNPGTPPPGAPRRNTPPPAQRPPQNPPRRPAPPRRRKPSPVLPLLVLGILLVAGIVLLVKVMNRGTPDDTAPGTQRPPVTDPVTSPGTDPVTAPDTQSPDTQPSGPVQPENTVIRFAAAGDVLIHECVFRDAAALASTQGGTDYDFDTMLAGIRSLIGDTDLAYVNMECPIAGNQFGIRGYPDFNAPTEAGDALVRLGFNVVNVANNHMLDMDPVTTGYQNSVAYWKTKNVLMIGGYESAEDYATVRTVMVQGITIAFLAYTYGTGTVGSVNSGSPEMVVPKIRDSVIREQITAARQTADLVFVSMHWGQDSAEAVTDEQVRLGQFIADCGADLIIGTHSHTVQPMTWLIGAGGNRTLCIYSLGNLISSQLYLKTILENVVTLDIVKTPEGKLSLENVTANPVVCHYETDTAVSDGLGFSLRQNIRLYRLEDYTDALCARHGAHLAYGTYKKDAESFTVASLSQRFRNIIDQEFWPDSLR